MLIKRPGPEEQALWRAYADLIDKYQVGPAMAKEKLLVKHHQRKRIVMAGEEIRPDPQ